MELINLERHRCFGGEQSRFKHSSSVLGCEMTLSVFLPPQAIKPDGTTDTDEISRVPVVYWLSGLTCTDENFVQKAGAQQFAARLGLAIIVPDTSPRGEHVPDKADSYDLGQGAGFYLNATQLPWSTHYRMYDYITDELPALVEQHLPIDNRRAAISGHSMGGHGALTIALRNPRRYRSVSAFSPITAPSQCPWGRQAFAHYLGDNPQLWEDFDAVKLITSMGQDVSHLPVLIDQGTDDGFLEEQLRPELLVKASLESGYPIALRMQTGYDHSYFFIASFIEEHLRFHAMYLKP